MGSILCYGDSNTHGTLPMAAPGLLERHPRGARWPEVMARLLGPEAEVIAEGLPGRTTVHEDVHLALVDLLDKPIKEAQMLFLTRRLLHAHAEVPVGCVQDPHDRPHSLQ